MTAGRPARERQLSGQTGSVVGGRALLLLLLLLSLSLFVVRAPPKVGQPERFERVGALTQEGASAAARRLLEASGRPRGH